MLRQRYKLVIASIELGVSISFAWTFLTHDVNRQVREVFVHRLVIADTIEERIMALQEKKQK